MSITEDYSPIYIGDTQAIFAPQFFNKNGTPVNLSGCTISMTMELYSSIASTVAVGTTKTCSGTWVIDDATNGKAHYPFQSADVNVSGVWNLWVVITNGSGSPVHADDGNSNPKRIVILPTS